MQKNVISEALWAPTSDGGHVPPVPPLLAAPLRARDSRGPGFISARVEKFMISYVPSVYIGQRSHWQKVTRRLQDRVDL